MDQRGRRKIGDLNLGFDAAQYEKGVVVGLWSREWRERKMRPKPAEEEREAEEADKIEVAPGVTVASLRRSRVALIDLTHGVPERRRVCR